MKTGWIQALVVSSAVFLSSAAGAAERAWTGGGADAAWSTGANWGGTAPEAGDALSFGGTAGLVNTNDFEAGMPFAGLTFLSGAGAFALWGNGITLDGDVANNDADTQTLNLPLALSATRAFDASAGALTVNGALSGMGGIDKTGAHALILTGSNTYEGVTTVGVGGSLRISHGLALGSTNGLTSIADGGWLEVSGGVTVAEPLEMRGDVSTGYAGVLRSTGGDNIWSGPISFPVGNSRIRTANNSNIEITGGITGAGLVLAANSGRITISTTPVALTTSARINSHDTGLKVFAVSNNVWGILEVAGGGETRVDVENALPTNSALQIGVGYSQSGTFNLNGNDQTVASFYSGVITNAGNRIVTTPTPAVLTVNQSGDTVYDGRLTGELGLVKSGPGTLSLTGTNNTQSGSIAVTGGKLGAVSEQSLGADPAVFTAGQLTLDGGVLFTAASWALDDVHRGVTLGANHGTVEVIAPAVLTLATPITGVGGLTKTGAGTLTLAGVNDYAGITTVNAGVLQIGQKTSLNNGTALSAEQFAVNSGATLSLHVGGAGEFTSEDIGAIAAQGSADTGFKPGSRFGLTVANAPGGRYEVPDMLGDAIEGTAFSLHKLGDGALALTGLNTYTGATILSAGVLEANVLANGGEPSSIGASATNAANLVFAGGVLRYTGPTAGTDRRFTLSTGDTAVFDVADPAASLTFTRIRGLVGRSDNTVVVKNGPGTLIFGNDGIINGGADNYIGMIGGFVINEGTYLNVSGDPAQLNTIRSASQGPAVTLGDGVYMGIGAALSRAVNGDEQTVRYVGTNRMATTYIGALQGPTVEGQWNTKIIDVNDGAAEIDLLVLGNMGIYPGAAISRIRKEGSGTLKFSGSGSVYKETTIIRAGRLLIGANVPKGGNSVLGNCTNDVVIGDGGTQPGDTPALLFDGAPGSAFICARGLATWTTAGTSTFGSLSNVNIVLSGSVTVSNTLHLLSSATGANALSVTGGIAGPGGVTLSGGGTVLFAAANTYTGATTVAAGTLRLGAAGAIAAASPLRLTGGALDLNGFGGAAGPLDVDGAAEIVFNGGTLTCAESSAESWDGTLVLRGWRQGAFFIGESATLSEDQLARVTSPAGQKARQLPTGEVVLTPPGTMVILR
jgi:autotransporter-associated beta strand protein